MRKFSKRTTAIVSGATAVGLVTLGTVAYAAFTSSASADAGKNGAETFKPITVTSSTWLGVRDAGHRTQVSANMLPGEFGDVQLALKNPSTNTVNGKITKIEPIVPIASQIGGVSADNRAGCLDMLVFSTYTPTWDKVVLPHDGLDHTIALNNAVQLKDEADEKCQGMTFPTKFTITFAATREATTDTSSLLPHN
jgi:hypothetical protein